MHTIEHQAEDGIKSTLAKDKLHISKCHHCATCKHPSHARERKKDFATHGLLPTSSKVNMGLP